MAYQVYETDLFTETKNSITEKEQAWIEKMLDQLMENPFVGKPLRFPWFREKKLENKRLYYLIYEEKNCVYMIAFAEKKRQQKIIDYVLENKNKFKNEIEKISAHG